MGRGKYVAEMVIGKPSTSEASEVEEVESPAFLNILPDT